jgi:hypothetical protein
LIGRFQKTIRSCLADTSSFWISTRTTSGPPGLRAAPDEDQSSVRTARKFGSRRLKTKSDLPKPKKLTAYEKKIIKQAMASNKTEVPTAALQPSQRGAVQPKK